LDSDPKFKAVVIGSSGLGIGALFASLTVLEPTEHGFEFRWTPYVIPAFAVGSLLAWAYWRMVFRLAFRGQDPVRAARRLKRAVIGLLALGILAFLYPLRFVAAERRTDEQLQVMREEISRQREPTLSDQDFCASDVRFHRTLIAAAHNPALDLASAGVIEALQPAINLMVFRFRDRAQVADQHAAIHQALMARDGKAALRALTDYMDVLTTQYQAAQAANEQPKISAKTTPTAQTSKTSKANTSTSLSRQARSKKSAP
jgi:hypothetical protein